MKKIIINADDFGYSKGVNKGIIKAISDGVVTSTSVMVYGKYASEVSKLLKYNNISIGLHFELSQNINDIAAELQKQIELFVNLHGDKPDHIDVHKIMFEDDPELKVILENYSKSSKIPVRGISVNFVTSFFDWNSDGSEDLSRIFTNSLIATLESLPNGVHELMCHVGYCDDELMKMSTYSSPREQELNTLTSFEIKKYFAENRDMELISWKDI